MSEKEQPCCPGWGVVGRCCRQINVFTGGADVIGLIEILRLTFPKADDSSLVDLLKERLKKSK